VGAKLRVEELGLLTERSPSRLTIGEALDIFQKNEKEKHLTLGQASGPT
jgi:hypothetical protein